MRVECSEFRVQGSGFRMQGSGFRVRSSGSGVQGSLTLQAWNVEDSIPIEDPSTTQIPPPSPFASHSEKEDPESTVSGAPSLLWIAPPSKARHRAKLEDDTCIKVEASGFNV